MIAQRQFDELKIRLIGTTLVGIYGFGFVGAMMALDDVWGYDHPWFVEIFGKYIFAAFWPVLLIICGVRFAFIAMLS